MRACVQLPALSNAVTSLINASSPMLMLRSMAKLTCACTLRRCTSGTSPTSAATSPATSSASSSAVAFSCCRTASRSLRIASPGWRAVARSSAVALGSAAAAARAENDSAGARSREGVASSAGWFGFSCVAALPGVTNSAGSASDSVVSSQGCVFLSCTANSGWKSIRPVDAMANVAPPAQVEVFAVGCPLAAIPAA